MSDVPLLYASPILQVGFCNIYDMQGRIFYEALHSNESHIDLMPPGTEISAHINPYAYFLFVLIVFNDVRHCFFISANSGKYLYIDMNGRGNLTPLAVNTVINPLTLEFVGATVISNRLILGNTAIGRIHIIPVKKMLFNIVAMDKMKTLEVSRSKTPPYSILAEVLSAFSQNATQSLTYTTIDAKGYHLPLIESTILTKANEIMGGTGITRTTGNPSYAVWNNCNASQKPTYLLLIGSSGTGKSRDIAGLAKYYGMEDPVHLSYDNPIPYFADFGKLSNFELRFLGVTEPILAADPTIYAAHYSTFAKISELIGKAARNSKVNITSEKADADGIASLINKYREQGYIMRIVYKPTTDKNQRYINMYRRFLSEGRYGKLLDLDSESESIFKTILENGLTFEKEMSGMFIFSGQ